VYRNTPADVKFAVRMMKKKPGFTAAVIVTLAIGIGATTAMFGTIHAALLSSLPFDEPDRLVMGRATFDGQINPWVSGYDYYDYRDQSVSFESLSAFMFGGRVSILAGAEPALVDSAFCTWDLFHTLRTRPAAGRLFMAAEGVENGPNVVMVSHAYWQRSLGGASDVVGSPLIMNGSPSTVVGVLPAGFHFLTDADIWQLTYRNGPGAEARRWHNLLLVGRLEPDISVRQAQAEVDTISDRLRRLYPDSNEGKGLAVTGLHEALVENVRPSLLMLMGAVSLVLLLACSNVAGLLLARGQGRLTEIAVRSTMGASRRRLVRQLLTESTLMALVAGAAGVVLAILFQGILIRLLPLGELGITRPAVSAPVLLFALVVSVGTGILFGLVPALQGTIVDPSQQLKTGTRATWAQRGSMLRNGFVVAQVAISILLLIGAGLLIRSLATQMRIDPGFDPENVLTAGVWLSQSDYPNPEERTSFFELLVEEIQALPGVDSVGLVNRLPVIHRGGNIYLYTEDQPPEDRQASFARSADFRIVTPGYFETMGIPFLAGRDIAAPDSPDSPRVMVISQSLAELFFPDQNPLGKKLLVDMGELIAHEVVGVVGNARLGRVTSDPFHAMYMSYSQNASARMQLAVRSLGVPTALIAPIREIVRSKGTNIALADPATMKSIIDGTLSDYRVITTALGLLSFIAVLLALLGLYGVLAHFVSQRHQEIGVRMSLGGTARQVANLVLARGMVLVAIGVAVGLVASYWATSLVQRLLFGVESTDPLTFLTTALGFVVVATIACLVPALRATRVNPVIIMKAE
jgi:putative ABC transport system permease protein